MADQLTAGLNLAVVAVWVLRKRLDPLAQIILLVFLLMMTTWALFIQLGDFWADQEWLLLVINAIIFVLALWLIIETMQALPRPGDDRRSTRPRARTAMRGCSLMASVTPSQGADQGDLSFPHEAAPSPATAPPPAPARWRRPRRPVAHRRPRSEHEPAEAERDLIRVLVVDDHAMFREALRALFELHADIDVVAEAGDVAEAVERAAAARPDVVLLDVRLPDGSGAAACRDIRDQLPDAAVLMLTAYSDGDAVLAAIEGGAAGYMLKHADGTELAQAIRRVASGAPYLDPEVTTEVLDHLRHPAPNGDDRLARLTPTEQRILQGVAKGLTNRQIGARLGYAESTVKNYVSSILAKLEVSRRTGAVVYLLEHDSA